MAWLTTRKNQPCVLGCKISSVCVCVCVSLLQRFYGIAGIIAYLCPCYIFGKNAEQVGDSCCLCGFASMCGLIGLYARTHIRGKIRDQKGIEVSSLLVTNVNSTFVWIRCFLRIGINCC